LDISIPSTATASNLVTHAYTITVEYNRTGTVTSEEEAHNNFAVYSSDQADARLLQQKVETWMDIYDDFPTPLYLPSEARRLWIEAGLEEEMADEAYDRYGNFTDAKIHYDNALDLIDEALSSEVDKTSNFEDALLGVIDSARSYLSMQGYGYMIIGIGFGIGFLLMGIGVVVYLVRKSRTHTEA